MSGGRFDYKQHYIRDIVDSIKDEIATNNIKPGWVDDEEWDGQIYSDKTIAKFKEAIKVLRIAEVYAQRVDWLLSGDDDEESFHERLQEDLAKLAMMDKAMKEVDEKIALAKKNGTWDGTDVDEYMRMVRGGDD